MFELRKRKNIRENKAVMTAENWYIIVGSVSDSWTATVTDQADWAIEHSIVQQVEITEKGKNVILCWYKPIKNIPFCLRD